MNIAFDYTALRERIKKLGYSVPRLADAVGMGAWALGQKLRGYYDFKSTEIIALAEVLGISLAQIPHYFFQQKVRKSKNRREEAE